MGDGLGDKSHFLLTVEELENRLRQGGQVLARNATLVTSLPRRGTSGGLNTVELLEPFAS